MTLDKNNYVYIARTAALAVYQITDAAGDATLQSTATFSSTATPRSVTLSNNEGYVYTANEGQETSPASPSEAPEQLSSITGSPFAGPASVSAIGADKSGSYMVAVGYNGTSGIQLFTVGTTGALTLTTSAGTGTSTSFPAVLALSH